MRPRLKLTLATIVAAAVAALAPATALAGQITVFGNAGSGGSTCSLIRAGASGGMQAFCGNGNGSALNAVYLQNPAGTVGAGSYARGEIDAPAGLSIDTVSFNGVYITNMNNSKGYGGGSYWSGGGAGWDSGTNLTEQLPGNGGGLPGGGSYVGFQIVCGWSTCSNWGGIYVPSFSLTATENSHPSLIATGTNIWYQGNRWVRGTWDASLNGSDVTGVCHFSYWVDGAGTDSGIPWTNNHVWQQCPDWTWSTSLNTTSYGNGWHTYQVGDWNAAKIGSAVSEGIGFDNAAPSVSLAASNDANPGSWSAANHPVTVHVQPNVGPSGASRLSCTDNGNPLGIDGNSNVTVDGNGQHNIQCGVANNAIDSSGTVATGSGSLTVLIDEQTPAVALSGAAASPAWSNGTPTVTANGAEAIAESGIARTSCSAANQSTNQTASSSADGATDSLKLPSTGVWGVTCSSVTGAGTTGSASETVQVDQSTPQVAFSNGPSQSTWYTTAQSITVTGTATGPSSITQLQCSINGMTTTYPGSTETITVNPPGGNLACRSENAAGTWSPTASWTFMIESTPPTGYFQPTNPNDLSRVVATVADSQSGVAGGQIQIKEASNWQNVPTSFDAGIGRLTGTLPDDGSVPDGTYQLRAIVRNGAGDQGIVTTNVGGIPEIVTFPLRAVTQMNVGQSVVYVNRCTVRRVAIKVKAKRRVHGQRQPARLVRSCSPVATPRGNGNLQLSSGQAGEVSGLFQTADGYPLAGARLEVTQQAPGWSVQQLGTTTTDAHGRFSYLIAAGPSRTLAFTFPGNGTIRAAGATTTVHVTGSTTINVSSVIRAGHPARISGQVQGGYIPPSGVLVQLQYTVAGTPQGWESFGQPLHTTGIGSWSMSIGKWPRNGTGYTYRIRAVVPAQNGWPYQQALSAVVQRHVQG